MTFIANAYGRLGKPPKAITTITGKPMASVNIAVEVPTKNGSNVTHWLPLLAFGRTADQLLLHDKGDPIAVIGRMQPHKWTGKDGNEHHELQLVIDSLFSMRTAIPDEEDAEPDADTFV